MSNLVFINDNHRKFNGVVTHGGYSRNVAWEDWIVQRVKDFRDVRLGKGRIWHCFQVLCAMLFNKGKTIFLLYPTVGINLFYNSFLEKLLSHAFFASLRTACKRNKIVFDICDLKYEQAIDLEIDDVRIRTRGEEIEKTLFETKAYFIFASYQMRSYACKKYNIPKTHTDVCVNGGPKLTKIEIEKNNLDNNTVNFVYAGTLNKGRGIEKLIACFPEKAGIHLYLMGTEGEWINSIQNNITYLGAVEERRAHYFASLCDVGIIPYDEKRLYYNLAYPTKLSFYITANIPFLSTPVDEVKEVNDRINGGWLYSIEEWEHFFAEITKTEIQEKKENVIRFSDSFLWESIFNSNKFIN